MIKSGTKQGSGVPTLASQAPHHGASSATSQLSAALGDLGEPRVGRFQVPPGCRARRETPPSPGPRAGAGAAAASRGGLSLGAPCPPPGEERAATWAHGAWESAPAPASRTRPLRHPPHPDPRSGTSRARLPRPRCPGAPRGCGRERGREPVPPRVPRGLRGSLFGGGLGAPSPAGGRAGGALGRGPHVPAGPGEPSPPPSSSPAEPQPPALLGNPKQSLHFSAVPVLLRSYNRCKVTCAARSARGWGESEFTWEQR